MYKTNRNGKEIELLTAKEVMEIFRISKATLIRWSKEGILPAIKIGRRVLYDKNDILEVVEKHKRKGEPKE